MMRLTNSPSKPWHPVMAENLREDTRVCPERDRQVIRTWPEPDGVTDSNSAEMALWRRYVTFVRDRLPDTTEFASVSINRVNLIDLSEMTEDRVPTLRQFLNLTTLADWSFNLDKYKAWVAPGDPDPLEHRADFEAIRLGAEHDLKGIEVVAAMILEWAGSKAPWQPTWLTPFRQAPAKPDKIEIELARIGRPTGNAWWAELWYTPSMLREAKSALAVPTVLDGGDRLYWHYAPPDAGHCEAGIQCGFGLDLRRGVTDGDPPQPEVIMAGSPALWLSAWEASERRLYRSSTDEADNIFMPQPQDLRARNDLRAGHMHRVATHYPASAVLPSPPVRARSAP